MSASAVTARRRVKAIGEGAKVQNLNTISNTAFLYRGAIGCGPISYSQLVYLVPKCSKSPVKFCKTCLVANVLDGGTPTFVGVEILDGGTPEKTGNCVYDGGIQSFTFLNGGSPTFTGGALSGGSAFAPGSPTYDGGIP